MKIVALTGAGISKASGIPTFQEMGDLRQKLSRVYYRQNPKKFFETLVDMKMKCDKAKPNNAHISLAKYNIPIITMNIDGLHTKAGSTNVIEIHGNLDNVVCDNCSSVYNLEYTKENIYCPECDLVFDTNVVLYGDPITKYDKAMDLIMKADVLLVVGTSFQTSTAVELVKMAEKCDKEVEIINDDAEEYVEKYLEEKLS